MRRGLLWLNGAIAAVTLASAVAVLISDLTVAGYRAYYGDALWFVAGYVALQAWMLREFWRGSARVPWLALGKTLAAYLFLATFAAVGPLWMRVTPARYVYQLFDWGPDVKVGLFAFVFLGRGAFNTLNAFALTERWWQPLRRSRPVVGRLVTAVPIALTATCVWAFVELSRLERETFSAEAHEIAEQVLAGIDCDAVREHDGETTRDLRQRGDRRYQVSISYGCRETRVVVRAEDGRLGTAALPRPECCTL